MYALNWVLLILRYAGNSYSLVGSDGPNPPGVWITNLFSFSAVSFFSPLNDLGRILGYADLLNFNLLIYFSLLGNVGLVILLIFWVLPALQKQKNAHRYQTSAGQAYQGLYKRFNDQKGQLELLNKKLVSCEEKLKEKSKELLHTQQEVQTNREAISRQQEILRRKSQDTLDSIIYAKRIQEAMLPKLEDIKKALPQSFVLFEPRDIVSGDFYWFHTQSHRSIIAAIDCTGHGVPGAFLSMIGNELLNKIVILKGITEPDKILNQLQLEMRNTLKQKESKNEDGMEMSICVIHQIPPGFKELFGSPRIEFAGARNPLMYIKNGAIYEVKGDKIPIGGYLYLEEHRFTKHCVELDQETTFYIFSDGFIDQFGGDNKKKFMLSRFRELLMKIHQKPMKEQKKCLLEALRNWRGYNPQLDDILVIGARLAPS